MQPTEKKAKKALFSQKCLDHLTGKANWEPLWCTDKDEEDNRSDEGMFKTGEKITFLAKKI